MKPATAVLILALAATMSACTMHRVDIRQGNYITAALVEQIEPGMTRDQVKYLLGTPMTPDLFRNDRWEYLYYLESRFIKDERAHLLVWFDGNTVARVETKVPPPR